MRNNEPADRRQGQNRWEMGMSGAERKKPGGLFGMFDTHSRQSTAWLMSIAAAIAIMGCAGGGGKGPGSRGVSAGEVWALASPEQAERRMATHPASEQDPLGLMPLGWPDDVPLHPSSKLAYSGRFGTDGLYLVTLVPEELGTLTGVQAFHLESLGGWESLEVSENPAAESGSRALTIVAERAGCFLKVVSERAPDGFVSTLPESEYWKEFAGINPLVIRLYYTPLPPGE
jgi:hypothetical protein